jgi:hypothetical protein
MGKWRQRAVRRVEVEDIGVAGQDRTGGDERCQRQYAKGSAD